MATKNIVQIATDAGTGARAPTATDVFLGENPVGNAPFYSDTTQIGNFANSLITVNVKAFGAVGDDVTDDSAAIQAAVDSLSTDFGGTVIFPPGRYLINTGIVIPKSTTSMIAIFGYGALIRTTAAIKMISRERPIDQGEAVNLSSGKFHIEGLILQGAPSTIVGIEMSAVYGPSFTNIQVVSCITGYDVLFCLNSIWYNCYAVNCETDSYVARTGIGEWSGTSLSNSQSNHSKFISCRSFAKTGADAQFKLLGSSGIEMQGCITEGGNPDYAVFFDDIGSTVVRAFKVTNHHSENAPVLSVFRIDMNTGLALLDHIFHQVLGPLIVDATGSGSQCRISFNNVAFIPSNSTFKTQNSGAPIWYITNPGDIQFDLDDPARWVGGVIGKYIIIGSNNASLTGMFAQGQIDIDGQNVKMTAQQVIFDGDIYTTKATAATTPGSVIQRLAVFDGTTKLLIGYLPIYDDIT